MAAILIRNIKTLWQTDEGERTVVKGKDMATIPCINNAWLWIDAGKIVDFGPMETMPELNITTIDATGKMVLPAYVDSHTHIVYAANRDEEFLMRLKGKTYEEIAAAGGHNVIALGTGTIEIKSGYGLNTAAEIKMLRVIRKLKENSRATIKSTFLGAHALPAEYKNNRKGYIDLIINDMLPKIADEGLADYCDVFCEQGYFTNEETETILSAAWKYHIKPKIHVNQFTNTGGIQTGIKNNAVSVDHLEYLGDAEIDALLQSNTLPVALPGCSFFIQIPYTPGRKIIDAGLPLVLASDYNPGSCPSGNMNFVIALACIQMKLTPEEAFNAATLNGAAALELSGSVGSIAKGKSAKIIITKPITTLTEIPYRFGENLIDRVLI